MMMPRIPALLCLLLGTTATVAALTTVDVGASAVNGEWRPGSCDDVKDGVVLTNIGDNVRAVIEGCGIHVDAGTDPSLSAVSISSIGSNSTVELLECNISATYDTTHSGATSAEILNRHATVRLKAGSIMGSHSALIVDHTSVSMVENGRGKYGAGLYLDSNLTVGTHFRFLVSSSQFTVACERSCRGIAGEGHGVDSTARSMFGDYANFTVFNTTVVVTSTTWGMGIAPAMACYAGAHTTLAVVGCNVTVRGMTGIGLGFEQSGQYSTRLIDSTTSTLTAGSTAAQFAGAPGRHSTSVVRDSNLTVTDPAWSSSCLFITSSSSGAFQNHLSVAVIRTNAVAVGGREAVALKSYVFFGDSGTLVVDQSVLTATGGTKSFAAHLQSWTGVDTSVTFRDSVVKAEGVEDAVGVYFPASITIIKGGVITIDKSTVTAASSTAAASAVSLNGQLTSVVVRISSSTLQFLSKAFSSTYRGSALSLAGRVSGTSAVEVTSTRLVAAAGTLTNGLSYIAWRYNIGGSPRQVLDGVTFERASGVTPAAFRVDNMASTDAFLCIRNTRWHGGGAITSGPAAFKTSGSDHACYATWTQPMTPTLPITQSAAVSSTRTLPPTPSPTWSATQVPTPSLSRPPTVTASPTPTATPTASSTKLPTPSASFTMSRSPTTTVTPPPTTTMAPSRTLSTAPTLSPTFSATHSPSPSVSAPLTQTAPLTNTTPPTRTISLTATPTVSKTRSPLPSVTATPPMTQSPAASGSRQPSPTLSHGATRTHHRDRSRTASAVKQGSSLTTTMIPPTPAPTTLPAVSSSSAGSTELSGRGSSSSSSSGGVGVVPTSPPVSSSSSSRQPSGGTLSSASSASSTGSGFQIGGRVEGGGNAASSSNAAVWGGVGAAVAVMLAAVAAAGFGVWLWRRSKNAEPPLVPVTPGPAVCDKEWRGQSLSQRKSMATEDGLAVGGAEAGELEGKAVLEDSVNNPFATEEDVGATP